MNHKTCLLTVASNLVYDANAKGKTNNAFRFKRDRRKHQAQKSSIVNPGIILF